MNNTIGNKITVVGLQPQIPDQILVLSAVSDNCVTLSKIEVLI